MVAVTAVQRAGSTTRAELDAMPDDGRRHELIDGVLVVSPAPSRLHQIVDEFAVADLPVSPVVAGCPSYWAVDPAVPSAVAWELCEGAYAKVADATGTDPFTATMPFPVTFRPADLIT